MPRTEPTVLHDKPASRDGMLITLRTRAFCLHCTPQTDCVAAGHGAGNVAGPAIEHPGPMFGGAVWEWPWQTAHR